VLVALVTTLPGPSFCTLTSRSNLLDGRRFTEDDLWSSVHEKQELIWQCASLLWDTGSRPSSEQTLEELKATKSYSNMSPIRCNVTRFILSGNCSTCFGWYLHPSTGAQTPVSTASGICHTVNAVCRYRGRVGTGLSVLWVAYATHNTAHSVPVAYATHSTAHSVPVAYATHNTAHSVPVAYATHSTAHSVPTQPWQRPATISVCKTRG
jgi:hypothetical protein